MADIAGGLLAGTTDAFGAGTKPIAGGVLVAGSPDATPPVLANQTPAAATKLKATDIVEFDLYDVSPGLALARIDLEYSNDSRRFVVHTGSTFKAPFATYSTRTGAGTKAAPYHFKLKPDGGWQAGLTITVLPVAVDAAGNVL